MRKVGLALDLAVVILFVAIGRNVHDHGLGIAGLASTSWPFLAGLGLAWSALTIAGRDGSSFSGGLVVWISTVVLGMTLRVLSGQGTAIAFILVALGFLGSTMLGGRVILMGFRRRRSVAHAADGSSVL